MDNPLQIDKKIYNPWMNRVLELKARTMPHSEKKIMSDIHNAFKKQYKGLIVFALLFIACVLLGNIIFLVLLAVGEVDIKDFLFPNLFWVPTAIVCLIAFFFKRKYAIKEKRMHTYGIKTVKVRCVDKQIFDGGEDTAYFVRFSDDSICRIKESWYKAPQTAIGEEFYLIYINEDEHLPVIGYKI